MRRAEIFRLVASLPPVKVSDLTIPKPQQLRHEDAIRQSDLATIIKTKQDMTTSNGDDHDILTQIQVCNSILGVGSSQHYVLSKITITDCLTPAPFL